jgi:hypothetical protein
VKDQYVGDINDYRKYALLRALSSGGANRVGVCWMLTPPDGGMDGGKLVLPPAARVSSPRRSRAVRHPWRMRLLTPDRRRLATIEDSGAIPGALYQNDPAARRTCRPPHLSLSRCAYAFRDVDLIFFDPDNGLEVSSLPKGRRNSSKYLYLSTRWQRSTFPANPFSSTSTFPGSSGLSFLNRCAERLRVAAPGASLWAFTTAHVVFLLLLHPASTAHLNSAADAACTQLDAGVHIRSFPRDRTSDPIIDGDLAPVFFGKFFVSTG